MCVYSSYSCELDRGVMFWKQSEYLTVHWPQDSEHQPTPRVCASILPLTKVSTHQILSSLYVFMYKEHKLHFQSIKQANKKELHYITDHSGH